MWGYSADQWTIFSAVASMVGAIGTLIAAGIALYIWLRDRRIDLTLNGWPANTAMGYVGGEPCPLVYRLTVNNRGLRTTTIVGFGFCFSGPIGLFNQEVAYIFPQIDYKPTFNDPLNLTEMRRLEHGNYTIFDVPLEIIEQHLKLRFTSRSMTIIEVWFKMMQTDFFVHSLEQSEPTDLTLHRSLYRVLAYMIIRKRIWQASVA